MKEAKENIRRGIIEMGVNYQCDMLEACLEEFQDEFYNCENGVDYHGYLCDMQCDCYKIQTELLFSSYFINDALTKKINTWYTATEELIFDLKCWLRTTCIVSDNIDIRVMQRLNIINSLK